MKTQQARIRVADDSTLYSDGPPEAGEFWSRPQGEMAVYVDESMASETGEEEAECVLAVGTVLDDRYEVLEKIAHGGFGEVYKARELGAGRGEVAIKILKPKPSNMRSAIYAEASQRFEREAMCLRRIHHPNVVQLYTTGTHGPENQLYLVTEYVAPAEATGHITLHERVFDRDHPLIVEEVCELLEGLLKALSAIHNLGIIHRDLKESNVLLAHQSDGSVVPKVIDFGIAMYPDARDNLTQADGCFSWGTRENWPPEVRTTGHWDERSEVYTVGLILFRMLTQMAVPLRGTAPASPKSRASNASAILLPQTTIEAYPKWLCELCLRALAHHPEDRFESASAFLMALDQGRAADRRPVQRPGLGALAPDRTLPWSTHDLWVDVSKDAGKSPRAGQKAAVPSAPEVAETGRGGKDPVRTRDKWVLRAAVAGGALVLIAVLLADDDGRFDVPDPVMDPGPRPIAARDLMDGVRRKGQGWTPGQPKAQATMLAGSGAAVVPTAFENEARATDSPSKPAPSADPNAPPSFQLTRSDGAKPEAKTPSRSDSVAPSAKKPAVRRQRRGGGGGSNASGGGSRSSRIGRRASTGVPSPAAASGAPRPGFDQYGRPIRSAAASLIGGPLKTKSSTRLPKNGEPLRVQPGTLHPAVLLYALSSHRPGGVVVAQLAREIELPGGRKIPRKSKITGTVNSFSLRGETACYVDIHFKSLVLPEDRVPHKIDAIATVDGQPGLPCRVHGEVDREKRRGAAVAEGVLDIVQDAAGDIAGLRNVTRRVLENERNEMRSALTAEDPPATVSAGRAFQLQFVTYQ